MKTYLKIIQHVMPNITLNDINLPFNDLDIDSIDLVTMRVEFERYIGKTIPDLHWVHFKKIRDIIDYCNKQSYHSLALTDATLDKDLLKELTIDMPQMAIAALSENWLFRELGDIHWKLICDGLNTKSFDLKDELGNRLYATFVRINIQNTIPINMFKENQKLQIKGRIRRYGHSMYLSDIILKSSKEEIKAKLMSSFTIRNEADNTRLVKSQPSNYINTIEEVNKNPNFSNEYRLIKKNILKEITTGKESYIIQDDFIYKSKYTMNPYYDLNGVGLLYFASYPTINDVCEARYFNGINSSERWELTYYTLSRDVFYYANCNIDDEILYKLHSCDIIENHAIKLSSSLYRLSDNTLMAKIFTVKRKQK